MKFSVKDFCSKSDQIPSFLRTWSHLLKKSLIENFLVLAVIITQVFVLQNFRITKLGWEETYSKMWCTEAATRGVLWEKVFLEILQNSQENAWARVSFLIKLQVSETIFFVNMLQRLRFSKTNVFGTFYYS